MVIPRCFSALTTVWSWSLIWYVVWTGFLFLVILMTSHLVGLNDICHSFSQACSLLRSSCNNPASGLLILPYCKLSSANRPVVDATFRGSNFQWQIIYIDEEQQGSQDCPLGDSGRTWSLGRCLTLSHNLLASVSKEAFDPFQEVSSNSIMMQFDCKSLMTDLVESFTEIEENGINLFIFLHG